MNSNRTGASIVGIFGGTFDPVHCGHVALATAASEALGLAATIILPNGSSPHRAPAHASPTQRLAWVREAFSANERVVVDDREINGGLSGYSVDSLEDLQRRPPQALARWVQGPIHWVWLIGVDAFQGIASWHRAEDLPKLCHFAVVARPGHADPIAGEFAGFVHAQSAAEFSETPAGAWRQIKITTADVSSTSLRQRLASSDSSSAPESVFDDLPPHISAKTRQDMFCSYA